MAKAKLILLFLLMFVSSYSWGQPLIDSNDVDKKNEYKFILYNDTAIQILKINKISVTNQLS